jgi:predicted nuclease of predicted toxin-antitoxin system
VRFLIDAQLPPALARMLNEHGHFAEHVNDVGLGDAADLTLWIYAIDQSAVLVTKDEDFRDMLLFRGSPPVVVWIRVGNARRQALLEWFEPLIDRVVSLIESGNDLVELR